MANKHPAEACGELRQKGGHDDSMAGKRRMSALSPTSTPRAMLNPYRPPTQLDSGQAHCVPTAMPTKHYRGAWHLLVPIHAIH